MNVQGGSRCTWTKTINNNRSFCLFEVVDIIQSLDLGLSSNVPLNAVVEESIGHQVSGDGQLLDGDVRPHPIGVLVEKQVCYGVVLTCR